MKIKLSLFLYFSLMCLAGIELEGMRKNKKNHTKKHNAQPIKKQSSNIPKPKSQPHNPDVLSDEAFNQLLESGCFNNIEGDVQPVTIDITDEDQQPLLPQKENKRIHTDIIQDNNQQKKKKPEKKDLIQNNKNSSDALSDEELDKLLKNGTFDSHRNLLPKLPVFQKLHVVTGLKNFGSSCYFNSIIQCLAQSGILLPALLHAQEHYLIEENTKKFPLQRALVELLIQLQENQKNAPINPEKLYQFVIKERFNNSKNQQCAYECLGFLIDQLITPAFDTDKVFQGLFQSYINKKTHCSHAQCRYEGNNIDPYTILDLPLHQINQTSSLETIIESFFNKETTSDWKCLYCNNKGSRNIYKFTKNPELFIVNLKRYKFVENKNKKDTHLTPIKVKTPVTFPLNTLNTTNYHTQNNYNIPITYDLVGIVLHKGELQSGHYVSFVKNEHKNCWFYCNDSHIEKKETSIIENISKSGLFKKDNNSTFIPSILMYKKRG